MNNELFSVESFQQRMLWNDLHDEIKNRIPINYIIVNNELYSVETFQQRMLMDDLHDEMKRMWKMGFWWQDRLGYDERNWDFGSQKLYVYGIQIQSYPKDNLNEYMKYDYSVLINQDKDSIESILEVALDGIDICENALNIEFEFPKEINYWCIEYGWSGDISLPIPKQWNRILKCEKHRFYLMAILMEFIMKIEEIIIKINNINKKKLRNNPSIPNKYYIEDSDFINTFKKTKYKKTKKVNPLTLGRC